MAEIKLYVVTDRVPIGYKIDGLAVSPGDVIALTDVVAQFEIIRNTVTLSGSIPTPDDSNALKVSDKLQLLQGSSQRLVTIAEIVALLSRQPTRTIVLSSQMFRIGTAKDEIIAAISAPDGMAVTAETTFGGKVYASAREQVNYKHYD